MAFPKTRRQTAIPSDSCRAPAALRRGTRPYGRYHPRTRGNRIAQRQQVGRRSPRPASSRKNLPPSAAQSESTRLRRLAIMYRLTSRAHPPNKPVLLLGHIDTVYPLGTLATMPCHIKAGRLLGPGVLDMKSGIGLMLHVIEALQAEHPILPRPITVLLVSDEEVGSDSSRADHRNSCQKIRGRARAGAVLWTARRG